MLVFNSGIAMIIGVFCGQFEVPLIVPLLLYIGSVIIAYSVKNWIEGLVKEIKE